MCNNSEQYKLYESLTENLKFVMRLQNKTLTKVLNSGNRKIVESSKYRRG